jgi:hypothetical protein
VANDFADALEHTEPKFARWMRKHGKVAVIKDDEVDRIERKARREGAREQRVPSSPHLALLLRSPR